MPDLDIKEPQRKLKEERQKNENLTFNDKLGAAERATLVDTILKEVEQDDADKNQFINKRNEILDVYEGKRVTVKTDPFPGCADVKTMLTASNIELLHSRLLPSLFNEELMFWRARERSDAPYTENVRTFSKWMLEQADFNRFVDDWIYNLPLEGTEISKVRWNMDWRWVARRVPNVQRFRDKLVEKAKRYIGLPSRQIRITHKDYKVKYDYIKLEKAVVEELPLEDVGFPVWESGRCSVNELHHIWHRYPKMYPKVKQMADMGIFDPAEVERCKNARKDQMQSQGTDDKRKQHEGGQGAIPPDSVVRCILIERHGPVEIPGSGTVECVTWVEKETGIFLGCIPSAAVIYTGERPFDIAQFVRRKGRMYGKSIAELGLMEIEKEVDTIHCQRLDAAKMAIVPPSGYRPASGFNPEMTRMAPGLSVPLDNPREDFVWYGMANNIVQGMAEENMLIKMAERLTSIGDLQSGQESSTIKTRSTARGTLAVLAQSERRFTTLALRMQVQLARIIKLLLRMWQTHMPPGMEDRVLGPDGKRLFPEGFSAEDIAGEYDVTLAIDPFGGSKAMEKEAADQLYTILIQNPLVAQNATRVWELTSRVVKARNIVDVESIIGPKPPDEETEQPQTVEEKISELQQGRLPDIAPGEDIAQIAAGFQLYMDTDDFKDLETEKQELVKVYIMALQAEMMNRAQQMQFEQQRQMMMGTEPMGGAIVGVPQQGMAEVAPGGPAPQPFGGGQPAP